MSLLWQENKGGGVMKEVFENIKEKIKNQPIEQFVDTNGNWDLVQTVLDCCCEAVDRVKEEYNNGWIPCSERLPDTEHISGVSESVLVTTNIHSIFTAEYHRNGKWLDDVGDWSLDVIAWMPLPAPYQPKGEE